MIPNSAVALFSNIDAVLAAIRRAAVNLVPPPDMLPTDWAEANIRIPVGNAIPGPINFDNAPHQRGMIDVIKEPGIRRVDYMCAAQTGKTTVQQCITAYFIGHEPRSQIFVQPTQGDVQTFLETKLRPMIQANPAIANKMAKQRGREGVNNGRIISYIGGWLMFSWAGSPKTLRGRSAPVRQADEVDGMAATPEGDPLSLLDQRGATFGDDSLGTRSSTPTFKGASRIETGYLEGDQRRYYVACPDCDHSQYFKWQNVNWTGRVSIGIDDAEKDAGQEHLPETATYSCENCGSCWDDGQRIAAVRNAEKLGHGWKAARPFKGHASFHCPEMLSTFRRLRDIVQSYLDKLAADDLQSFVNVSLAETWEEKGESADPTGLMKRREIYAAQVPAGGLWLTAGIDMQMDRLEVETVAWGVGEESWSIDYTVLWGDPMGDEVWQSLDEYLAQGFVHESGVLLPISASCLDTGGTNGMTQAAYDYAKGKTGRRLFAIKGVPGWSRPIVEKPQRKQSGKNSRKVDLFLVGVDVGKLIHMRRLANDKPGTGGYCHFPHDRDEDWFKQITAEKMITRYEKGQPIREWHKSDRARNEGTDCRVYAFAALKAVPPNFTTMQKRLNDAIASLPPVITPKPAEKPRPAPRKAAPVTAAENPQVVEKPVEPQNPTILKSRRTLKKGAKRDSWATKWG